MAGKKEAYRALRGEQNYWLYVSAIALSRLGDSVDALAFGWIAYQISGSAVWLAAIAGINALPTIFITPFIAPLVEHWPKRLVMTAAAILRGGLVCLTGCLMVSGVLTPWHLAGITFGMSLIESFSDPAYMASVPLIIPKDKLDAALSLRSAVSQVAQLLGAALGGVIIGLWGGGFTLMADAGLFLLSALPLAALRLAEGGESPAAEKKPAYFAELKSGLGYFFRRPALMALCFMGLGFNVLGGPVGQLEAACVAELLKLDAYALSVSRGVFSGGMLLGTLLYPFLQARINLRATLMIAMLALAVDYGGMVLLSLCQAPWLKYAGLVVFNLALALGITLVSMVSNILFFKVIESGYLARMASIFNAFAMLASPLASVLGGALAAALPLAQVYLVTCVLTLAGAAITARLKIFKSLESALGASGQAA